MTLLHRIDLGLDMFAGILSNAVSIRSQMSLSNVSTQGHGLLSSVVTPNAAIELSLIQSPLCDNETSAETPDVVLSNRNHRPVLVAREPLP